MSIDLDPDASRRRELLLRRFEAVEVELALDAERVDGIPWWDLTRYPYHRALLLAAGLIDAEALDEAPRIRTAKQLLTLIGNLLLAFTIRSPSRGRRGGVVVIGHPRRRREEGRWVDLYVDPLLTLLAQDRVVEVLEEPIDLGHRRPAATPHLRYLDGVRLLARLSERRMPGLTQAEQDRIAGIGRRFADALGVEVDLAAMVATELRRWRARQPRYRRLLQRLAPSCVLIVRSARQETWVAAARDLGLPVAELQHGSPTRGKLNYDYGSGIGKSTFPDVFAAFGPFWTSDIRMPVAPEAVFDLGFPYLSGKRARYDKVAKRDQLLVLSQPDVAEVLTAFCLRLAAVLPAGVRMVYKPHPAEIARGEERFQRLRAGGIEVAQDPNADLYGLLAESRWQLGVYSTALYEGLAFGCACFVLRAAGAELMQRVVDMDLAQYVSEPEEVDLSRRVDAAAARVMFSDATPERAAALIERLVADPSAPSAPVSGAPTVT